MNTFAQAFTIQIRRHSQLYAFVHNLSTEVLCAYKLIVAHALAAHARSHTHRHTCACVQTHRNDALVRAAHTRHTAGGEGDEKRELLLLLFLPSFVLVCVYIYKYFAVGNVRNMAAVLLQKEVKFPFP